MKIVPPMASFIQAVASRRCITVYVIMAGKADANSILVEDWKSALTLYCFHVQWRPRNMLGKPERMIPIIAPIMPSVGIRRKAKGMLVDRVRRPSFMSIFVLPRPVRSWIMLSLPETASRKLAARRVRKRGA